jgi:hypothetical protein
LGKRFWDKVQKGDRCACWLWQGAKNTVGYGRYKINGKLYLPHRLAWEERYGKIPKNKWVLHRCDNPACVNPTHLYIGTRSDNVKDALARGKVMIPKPEYNVVHGTSNTYKNGCRCNFCREAARQYQELWHCGEKPGNIELQGSWYDETATKKNR